MRCKTITFWHAISIGQSFPSNWVRGNSSNSVYKNDIHVFFEHVKIICIFNSRDKVERNFIKKAYASHMLLKIGHMSYFRLSWKKSLIWNIKYPYP